MTFVARTIWLFSIPVAVSIAFAVVLQWLGGRIRLAGVSCWSKAYWYFVSPGVACHELGHCVGCWLTGNRISKVVFFTANSDKYLGCVWHSSPKGLWGAVQSAVIASGPIWFGCLVIGVLSRLLIGSTSIVNISEYVDCSFMPSLFEYLGGCIRAALDIFVGTLLDLGCSPIRTALWLYLSFCIASEIGMSRVDMAHAWKGLIVIAVSLVILAMIPVVGKWVVALICLALPIMFAIHALMVLGVIVSSAMLLTVRALR